ncbi:MAG TPA: hypothetical protein VJU18_16045 [Vicinamibacteria bacterium]|nr:hypothetical protein [Vicinamibacteria bacterium]
MTAVNPWAFLFRLGDPEQRPLLIAFGGLALALGSARTAGPGAWETGLAVAILIGVPVLAFRLSGQAAPFFMLVASLGAWLVFRTDTGGALATFPVHLVSRLAYFAVPPLVLHLLLAQRDRERMKLGLLHLYAPAAVAGIGVAVHLALRFRDLSTGESEIRWAAGFYGLCYLGLLAAGLLSRLRAVDDKPKPAAAGHGTELEEQGRYGLAARAYEREGQVEKGAQAAERAGEWARAANLYRRSGDDFNAGEMYYRAQMWPEALECYERARSFTAAARLCLQLGQLERAVSFYEQAGDLAAAVRVLEDAGQRPTGEQYRRAGLLERAAEVFQEAGDWLHAAEIYEHDFQDPSRAAALHLKGGSFLHAGRLLESVGRAQEALEAYAAVPAGAVDAARLYLAAGRPKQAAELLARLPPAELAKLEDEATLTLVARVMVETGRNDEAIRMLQGLKRRGSSGGSVHLLLGRAFLNRNLHDLAEEELRTATGMPLEPQDEILAAYLLGCVLEAAKQPEEALQVFHGVLQKDFHYADVEERYRRLKPLAAEAARARAAIATHGDGGA